MNKALVLCAFNAHMMQEFSTRTIAGLKKHKLFKLLLPAFTSFLEVNVNKEIEKDNCVILHAAELVRQGGTPDQKDINQLLKSAKEIDQDFLQKISSLSSSINIHYREIEQYRADRTKKILAAVHQVLVRWKSSSRLRTTVVAIYNREQFIELLHEILALYIQETMALSRSVKIPKKLTFARDSLIKTVCSVMEKSAEDLSIELAEKVFSSDLIQRKA